MVSRERERAWRVEPGLLEAAERAFAASVAGLDEAPESAAALLEAAGRLVAMEAPGAVLAWAGQRADGGREVAAAVESEKAFEAVEDAAAALRALLDGRALGAGDVTGEALLRGVEEALEARHRVALRRLGAEAILGEAPELGVAQESALLVFESLVRPDLWRLTEANVRRREALAAIAPARRRAFWWWSEGADVAEHAVPALAAVAHLVARFPGAGEALASLVAAQRTWDEAARAPREASVVSLGAWLRRRAAAVRPGTGMELAAATIEGEVTLVDDPAYQVSWAAPDALVIDLVADRAPGTAPWLRRGDGSTVASLPVEGAEERFSLRVGAPLLEEAGAVLVLPLATGTIEVPLPPGGR